MGRRTTRYDRYNYLGARGRLSRYAFLIVHRSVVGMESSAELSSSAAFLAFSSHWGSHCLEQISHLLNGYMNTVLGASFARPQFISSCYSAQSPMVNSYLTSAPPFPSPHHSYRKHINPLPSTSGCPISRSTPVGAYEIFIISVIS